MSALSPESRSPEIVPQIDVREITLADDGDTAHLRRLTTILSR